jgi:hypothetical protein
MSEPSKRQPVFHCIIVNLGCPVKKTDNFLPGGLPSGIACFRNIDGRLSIFHERPGFGVEDKERRKWRWTSPLLET